MKRQVTMDEISDGKLYTSRDLVKADCGGCQGCHACCQGMGGSIVLDPLDIHHMTMGQRVTMEQLIGTAIELSVIDGLILPVIKMDGEDERCYFLDDNGRCSIHAYRPGICRLFPLGRYYEDGGFKYFLQTHECKKTNRTKVKVAKWLGIERLKDYEEFVCQWHYFLNDAEAKIKEMPDQTKAIDMYILKLFYLLPYDESDIYVQLGQRLTEARRSLNI